MIYYNQNLVAFLTFMTDKNLFSRLIKKFYTFIVTHFYFHWRQQKTCRKYVYLSNLQIDMNDSNRKNHKIWSNPEIRLK